MSERTFTEEPESPRIRVLLDSVARRIAAGEVIDRPYSVVRELLDNALDAGAGQIQLEVNSGGIGSLVCADDGFGMGPGDLRLCVLPHATSKIREFDDLYRLSSMGFRGEALASIAACSRLDILSRPRNSSHAWRIRSEGGRTSEPREDRGAPGTRISVEDLFYSLPGRKKFLKNPSTEGTLCFNAFLEKALAFPETAFRYFSDGKLKIFLPPGDLRERVVQAYSRILDPALVRSWQAESSPYSLTVVGASPSLYRRDRKYIQIYVNRRRVNEFALTQAVEYGYNEFLPGGCFPHAFVFITLPPDLVDFNIHPSKKEVRFRDLPGLHRAVTAGVKEGLKSHYRQPLRLQPSAEQPLPFFSGLPTAEEADPYGTGAGGGASGGFSLESGTGGRIPGGTPDRGFSLPARPSSPPSGKDPFHPYRGEIRASLPEDLSPLPGGPPAAADPAGDFRYLGQVMGLFLAVEKEDTLLLIDQHAAHERILFDRFRRETPVIQELLVPHLLELDEPASEVLAKNLAFLGELGFEFSRAGGTVWQLIALPSLCQGMEDEILEILTQARGDARTLEKELYARAACRRAVKDGDLLDRVTAEDLVRRSLALPEPRCPHGRPVWFELTRDELFRLVGRIF